MLTPEQILNSDHVITQRAVQISAFAVALILGFCYYRILGKTSKNNRLFRNTIVGSALTIGIINTVADWMVISKIAQGPLNVFSTTVLAVFHSVELFVFQTHFFDNGYQEYFFGKSYNLQENGPVIFATDPGHPWMAYLFAITFVLACVTSVALVIRALSRRRAGRVWLSNNKTSTRNSHIFFLGGEVTQHLALDIRKHNPQDKLIFVGYPDPEESYMDLTVWEKIRRLFKNREEEDMGPFDAIVYSRIPINETSGPNICKQMGLKDLDPFLKDGSCRVYLLTDSEKDNLHGTNLLVSDGCKATIYCRASREGLNRMYEDMLTSRENVHVRLIDSSYLAVRSIKEQEELLPVNFVKKGKDKDCRLEGWVSGPFNAMILGFGEMGREALGFVYEHAAFVNQRFNKSKFSCTVLDSEMDSLKESYQTQFPGMSTQAGIFFKQCEIGSNEFWKMMEAQLLKLNYILICLGNDQLNLNTAIDIAKLAFRLKGKRPDNFAILTAQEKPSDLDKKTLDFYNLSQQYENLIKPFGGYEKVWTYNNITNTDLNEKAKQFSYNYERSLGKSDEEARAVWENYEAAIRSGTDITKINDALRRRSQNYANCFHMSTKLSLVGPEIKEKMKEIAACIPPSFTEQGTHFTGDDEHVATVLHYLAVLEHIRWEASHVTMGYKPGEKTDVILKTHKCIDDYENLDESTKHYDYLVAKVTFELS